MQRRNHGRLSVTSTLAFSDLGGAVSSRSSPKAVFEYLFLYDMYQQIHVFEQIPTCPSPTQRSPVKFKWPVPSLSSGSRFSKKSSSFSITQLTGKRPEEITFARKMTTVVQQETFQKEEGLVAWQPTDSPRPPRKRWVLPPQRPFVYCTHDVLVRFSDEVFRENKECQ